MVSLDRMLLHLHIEAVWGVQLPTIEQNDIALLPASSLPPWRLCAADIAEGRIHIWRTDVTMAEREILLAYLKTALELPSTAAPPPGVSREVAFHLAATPIIDREAVHRLARPLTTRDDALVEDFDPASVPDLLLPACRPMIGVIVEGRLLSMAHSSRRTTDACELGIDTLPEARRKGYALAATVAWSIAISQEGLIPLYSALATNTASLNLAVAAGYREFVRAATVE